MDAEQKPGEVTFSEAEALARTLTRVGNETLDEPGQAAFDAGSSRGPVTSLPRIVTRDPELHLDRSPESRYVVQQRLGEGGMGEVLLVEDRDIQRRVAMKQIRAELAEHAPMSIRFTDEVRALGRLEHPNIVPIYDVGSNVGGQLFFTMKHVQGETVAALIERLAAGDSLAHTAWPLARRLDVFSAILEGLAYAHERGVLHLDIKPENVMIGPHGQVFLMDWGIASLEGETAGGTIAGSPAYMSPEQAAGRPLDARSDVYSAFIILYELLTLTAYTSAEGSIPAVLAQIQVREAPSLRSPDYCNPHQPPVPIEHRHFLARGLQLRSEDRYANAVEALEELHRLRSGDFRVQCPLTLAKHMQVRMNSFLEGHLGMVAA
ncbi:MAG: serine/threonine protein kinase, partial [Myxococcales bacterium]|nr:serine/threonine protein kinase [Myxococcales bacterium]